MALKAEFGWDVENTNDNTSSMCQIQPSSLICSRDTTEEISESTSRPLARLEMKAVSIVLSIIASNLTQAKFKHYCKDLKVVTPNHTHQAHYTEALVADVSSCHFPLVPTSSNENHKTVIQS